MKRKIQFAVILTDEGKTVLVVDNDGICRSFNEWQKRFSATGSKVLWISETDSIDLCLSHYLLS